MGTNYYFKSDNKHIGKRSAAGLYCWTCNITLCKEGASMVHASNKEYTKCPRCGAVPIKEGLFDSAAGKELFGNKKALTKKSGVSSCSSFSWAITYDEFNKRSGTILDEYGDKYTKKQFIKQVIQDCPIHFSDSMGKDFC